MPRHSFYRPDSSNTDPKAYMSGKQVTPYRLSGAASEEEAQRIMKINSSSMTSNDIQYRTMLPLYPDKDSPLYSG